MSSNIAVKITADVIDLQTKCAVAKAETSALDSAFNKLARSAAAAGGEMSSEMKAALTQMAESSLKAHAELNKLRTELQESQNSGHQFKASMDLVKQGLGALGIAASIEGIKALGEAILENAASIQHESEVLQLSVESYQAFRQAAIDSGVSTDQADSAIQRFSKNVSEAAVGTGPAAKALVEMGISASQSKEAVLQQVSAFLLHTDAVTRDRYATELFGRTGAEMIPLFGQWAQGADNLTKKYDSMGRTLSPQTTEAAEKADIKLKQGWESLKAEGAPAVVFFTQSLAGLEDMLVRVGKAAPNLTGVSTIADRPEAAKPYRIPTFEKAKPYIIPEHKAPTEQDEVRALDALDGKMRQRIDLEKELATAKKTAADAAAAHDSAGLAKANIVIADKQKELDALNKTKYPGGFANAGAEAISDAQVKLSGISGDPTKSAQERKAAQDAIYAELLTDARLNAAQINEVTKEKNKADIAADREAANEKRQIDQSNIQTALSLSKLGTEQQKQDLERQVAEGIITKQQELAQLIPIIEAERDAQLNAINEAERGYSTESAFFKEKENEKKVVVANTQAQITAIERQAAEERARQQESIDKQMYSELTSAETTFVQQMFSGRVGLLGALEAAGRNFIEKEIEDDLRYFTAHELLSKAELAKDASANQAGILLHSVMETEKTSASAAGTAARAGIKTTEAAVDNADFLTRAARWIAMELGMTTATTTAEATRTAAKTAATATAKAEEAAANVASAESYAGVAAAAAAAAVAGIPVVGPALAVAAAASTFAALQPYATIAALDVGAYDVPKDMPAYIHQGEMVVPKTFAAGLRQSIGGGTNIFGGNSSSSVGGDSFHVEQHFHGGNASQSARDMVDAINHQRRIGRFKG